MGYRKQKGFITKAARHIPKNSIQQAMNISNIDLNTYLSEPLEIRKDILKKANPNTCPFWLERLQTAVNTSNPFAVMFNQELINEYWDLKNISNDTLSSN